MLDGQARFVRRRGSTSMEQENEAEEIVESTIPPTKEKVSKTLPSTAAKAAYSRLTSENFEAGCMDLYRSFIARQKKKIYVTRAPQAKSDAKQWLKEVEEVTEPDEMLVLMKALGDDLGVELYIYCSKIESKAKTEAKVAEGKKRRGDDMPARKSPAKKRATTIGDGTDG